MNKKPCPFCGSKRLFISKSDCSWHDPPFAYSVGCAGADCHGHIFALGHDLFKTKKEAVEAWNERADADEIKKLRAALKDMAKHIWRGDWDKLDPETRALMEEKE
jgi:Lar family restriction alleviation protein